jgi:hypothetical protein
MAVQFPQFATPTASLLQGVSQGVDIGARFAQIGQMAANKRAQEWTMAVQKAELGTKYGNDPSLPRGTRLKALNQGLAPLLNDSRWGFGSGEPVTFTEADLDDEGLQTTLQDTRKIWTNKELSDVERRTLTGQRLSEYLAGRGDREGAVKMQMEMMEGGGKSQSVGRFQIRKLEDGRVYTIDTLNELPPQPHEVPKKSQSGQIDTPDDLANFSTTNPRDFKNINDNLTLFGKKIEEDSVIKKQSEKLADLDQIATQLDTENPAFTGLMTSILAKTVGREAGALTDEDVVRANGDPSLLARVKRSITRNITGKIPDSDREDFKELLRVARTNTTRSIEQRQENFFRQARGRISKNVTDNFLRAALLNKPRTDASGASPAGPAASKLTPEEEALVGAYQ